MKILNSCHLIYYKNSYLHQCYIGNRQRAHILRGVIEVSSTRDRCLFETIIFLTHFQFLDLFCCQSLTSSAVQSTPHTYTVNRSSQQCPSTENRDHLPSKIKMIISLFYKKDNKEKWFITLHLWFFLKLYTV